MANTYTSLHYHLVYSTKNRQRWIIPEIENRIWAYIGGIAKENRFHPIQIGGVEDHVHVLLGAPASAAPSKIAQLMKGVSSAWIHETFAGGSVYPEKENGNSKNPGKPCGTKDCVSAGGNPISSSRSDGISLGIKVLERIRGFHFPF